MERDVRWRDLRAPGLEQLHLHIGDAGIIAESVIAGESDGVRFGLKYRIECAPDWSIRFAFVEVCGKPWALRLFHDGQGNWTDEFDDPVPELTGCLDLDIQATPFTNTLAIRRLALAQGESHDLKVCYVSVPDLETRAIEQRYTCIALNRSYLYEGIFRDYKGELTVDADGIVVDYPETFVLEE